jgi:hypothetical protein
MLRAGAAAAAAAIGLTGAGCSKVHYKGGQVPKAQEGGLREPGTDISSLDELRGVVVRITPNGFSPTHVSVFPIDIVAFQNVSPGQVTIRKVAGQGKPFRSAPIDNSDVYQHKFAKPGKVVVRAEGAAKGEIVITVNKTG